MSRARGRPGSTVPLFGLVALASFGGIAAALVSQHVYAMEPCPWCVLQRLIFVAIGAVALVGLLWPARVGGLAAGVALLLALSGLASALWQHFVAAASASCNLTLADRIVSGTGLDNLLPDVFAARANCAEAAVDLLGVPYAFWAAALFVLCALAMLGALRRR
jgi:protein dithiol:quinone oxidoreductase